MKRYMTIACLLWAWGSIAFEIKVAGDGLLSADNSLVDRKRSSLTIEDRYTSPEYFNFLNDKILKLEHSLQLNSSEIMRLGGDVSGGGDVVVCYDAYGEVDTIEAFDKYRGQTEFVGLTFESKGKKLEGRGHVELAEQTLIKLKALDPTLFLFADYYLHEFLLWEKKLPRKKVAAYLRDNGDNPAIVLPNKDSGCKVKRIMFHNLSPAPFQPKYLPDHYLWQKADHVTKSWIAIHESLYQAIRMLYGATDSNTTQYINAILHSNQFDQMSDLEKAKLWSQVKETIENYRDFVLLNGQVFYDMKMELKTENLHPVYDYFYEEHKDFLSSQNDLNLDMYKATKTYRLITSKWRSDEDYLEMTVFKPSLSLFGKLDAEFIRGGNSEDNYRDNVPCGEDHKCRAHFLDISLYPNHQIADITLKRVKLSFYPSGELMELATTNAMIRELFDFQNFPTSYGDRAIPQYGFSAYFYKSGKIAGFGKRFNEKGERVALKFIPNEGIKFTSSGDNESQHFRNQIKLLGRDAFHFSQNYVIDQKLAGELRIQAERVFARADTELKTKRMYNTVLHLRTLLTNVKRVKGDQGLHHHSQLLKVTEQSLRVLSSFAQ